MKARTFTTNAIYPIIFLIFFIAQYSVLQNTLNDPDTAWHITAGDYIRKFGVSLNNVFSYSAPYYDWLNLSWLWDVGFSYISQFGGLYLASIITIITSSLLAVIILRECFQRSNLISAVVVTSLISTGLMSAVAVRPHLLSWMIIFIVYQILHKFVVGERSAKSLLLLPLLMAIWANIHGGVLAAVTIFGAFGLQLLIKREWKKLGLLAACFLLSAAATLLNPIGIRIYEVPLRMFYGPLAATITEWQPTTDPLMFIYPALALFCVIYSIKRQNIADVALFVFWLIQGILAARYMAIFMLLSAPATAFGLKSFLGKFPGFERKDKEYTSDLSSVKVCLILSFLADLAIIVSLVSAPKNFGISPDKYPQKEIAYLMQHNYGQRIFNYYDYGGFMIYFSKGEMKTFIDGRAETAFPNSVANDFINFTTMKDGWEKIPDTYLANVIFWPKDSKQVDILTTKHRWVKAFEGDKAAILVRAYE